MVLLAVIAVAVTAVPARSQSSSPDKNSDLIHQMSSSFENLVKRVSPAVVEVEVTGYGSAEEEDDDDHGPGPVGRQRSLGSGVIVDPDGYIITNFHVVRGAERVRVVLSPPASAESQAAALIKSRGRVLPARIVGFSKLIDIAVLKVEASGLPTLPIGRYERLEKGSWCWRSAARKGWKIPSASGW